MGDPAGIGPEVTAKAWSARAAHGLGVFFAVGDARAIEAVWNGPIARSDDPSEAEAAFGTALHVLVVVEGG
ncbi:hypothetical protein BH09PSE4_BH09PSE4_21700 [soil metagenome]